MEAPGPEQLQQAWMPAPSPCAVPSPCGCALCWQGQGLARASCTAQPPACAVHLVPWVGAGPCTTHLGLAALHLLLTLLRGATQLCHRRLCSWQPSPGLLRLSQGCRNLPECAMFWSLSLLEGQNTRRAFPLGSEQPMAPGRGSQGHHPALPVQPHHHCLALALPISGAPGARGRC